MDEITINVTINTRQFESYGGDSNDTGELSTERERSFQSVDSTLDFIKSKLEEAIGEEKIYDFSASIKLDK